LEFIETNLKDCYIIKPDRFGDERGYFSPYFIKDKLKEKGLEFAEVKQLNRSLSSKGTLRGLHFQKGDYAQAKIVECLQGKVLDVVVDIRYGSPTFGKWTSVLLTQSEGNQLFVPRGFAHGFVSLEDNSLFQYIVDNDYMPSEEAGILWNDPDINIDWRLEEFGILEPILSSKDKEHKKLNDSPKYFEV